MQFAIEAYLNNKLAVGKTIAEAIIKIKGEGTNLIGRTVRKRFLIMIDNSTSMEGDKLVAAKSAARQIIDRIPEDMEFGVVAWNTNPRQLVPFGFADSGHKRSADNAVKQIWAEGGTFMSNLLREARSMFDAGQEVANTGLLLTDGENDPKDQKSFERELELCKNSFVCHCRGFGADWDPAQLRMIEAKTAGSAEGIRDGYGLIENFQQILSSAQNKGVSDLRLRVRMPEIVRLQEIYQSFPRRISLTDRIKSHSQGVVEIMLGDWGDETKAYLASFQVEAQSPNGGGNLLFKPILVYTDPSSRQEIEIKAPPVMVYWSTNELETMTEDSTVAHYKGQTEKTTAKQEGVAAYMKGDDGRATVKFERVLKLAIADQDAETIRQLSKLGTINEAEGTIKLHRKGVIDQFAVRDLDVTSTRAIEAVR